MLESLTKTYRIVDEETKNLMKLQHKNRKLRSQAEDREGLNTIEERKSKVDP